LQAGYTRFEIELDIINQKSFDTMIIVILSVIIGYPNTYHIFDMISWVAKASYLIFIKFQISFTLLSKR